MAFILFFKCKIKCIFKRIWYTLFLMGITCDIFECLNGLKWEFVQQYSTNWIRQGGQFSPLLYNLFTDDLNHHLQATGVECYVGGAWVNSLLCG